MRRDFASSPSLRPLDWTTVVVTLGGASIGALAAIGGAVIQARYERKSREASERRELGRTAAAAVAPVRALLSQVEPRTTLAPLIYPETSEDSQAWAGKRLNAALEEWEERRQALTLYGAAHPSNEVGETAVQVIDAVESAMNAYVLAGTVARVDSPEIARSSVEAAYNEAVKRADELLALIRREP